jgi:hypothetical protein
LDSNSSLSKKRIPLAFERFGDNSKIESTEGFFFDFS